MCGVAGPWKEVRYDSYKVQFSVENTEFFNSWSFRIQVNYFTWYKHPWMFWCKNVQKMRSEESHFSPIIYEYNQEKSMYLYMFCGSLNSRPLVVCDFLRIFPLQWSQLVSLLHVSWIPLSHLVTWPWRSSSVLKPQNPWKTFILWIFLESHIVPSLLRYLSLKRYMIHVLISVSIVLSILSQMWLK